MLELLRAERRRTSKILISENQEPSSVLDQIEREAQRRRTPVQIVSRARLDKEARTEGHQGVIAFADAIDTVGLSTLISDDAFLIVADGLTDPRNLGAILRSADGAGVTGVVLPRHRSARITPAVTKTAAGAIEHLRFAEVGGVPATLATLASAGFLIVGLAGESSTSLYDLDLANGPVALVVGGEQNGLGQLVRKRCSVLASIPQRGVLSSLNAGVATSVAAYEVARQRATR